MTGVRNSHRRRGIARALKVHGLSFASDCGVERICTVHHPDNESMIQLNRELGYTDAQWAYPPGP